MLRKSLRLILLIVLLGGGTVSAQTPQNEAYSPRTFTAKDLLPSEYPHLEIRWENSNRLLRFSIDEPLEYGITYSITFWRAGTYEVTEGCPFYFDPEGNGKGDLNPLLIGTTFRVENPGKTYGAFYVNPGVTLCEFRYTGR
ncbi:MAG TPA: hypothetical protein VD999_05980 [Vitreimonas sp.]|nr:hypothetical protein [Vitreimonas sp.]